MHEILKRALDEALTAAYAEAIPVGAEDAAFSEGFEREMRGLIRRTDRPIQKYIPILTAAACAVIAIGCAVLLPRLLSHSVPVEPDEDSTTTVTSSVLIAGPVESTSAEETVPDGTDEIRGENPNAAGGILEDTEEDTTEWDDEDDDIGRENGVPAAISSSAPTGDFPAAETSDREEAAADDVESSDSVEDDIENEDDEADYDLVDEDIGVDTEDDADYDSDNADMDYDNDEATDESALPPITKRATLNGEVRVLLGCSLADSYLHSGNFMIDGKFYGLPIVEGIDPETYRDPELAKLIGAAKYIEGEPEERGLPLFWGNIGKEAPVIKPVNGRDQSDRNYYDAHYFGEDHWIEDEEDEDIENDLEMVYLEFFRDGIVRVFMDGYSGAAYYRLDDETLKALIGRIEARFDVSEPETVGDLMKQLGSAEDYARVYVSVTNYYDRTMSGALSDGTFLADLLKKYKNETLQKGEIGGRIPIRIELISRKTLRTDSFLFCADGTVWVGGNRFFKIGEADVRAILTEYCRQKNLPAPVFYETLGEYLTGKNFTTLIGTNFFGEDASDELRLLGDDAEIRALIEEYAAESAFLPDEEWISCRENIGIQVDGWFYALRINRDVITIGFPGNVFKTPDGLYDKLCAVISEKGESPYTGQDEDYYDDDVAEEVTDD